MERYFRVFLRHVSGDCRSPEGYDWYLVFENGKASTSMEGYGYNLSYTTDQGATGHNHVDGDHSSHSASLDSIRRAIAILAKQKDSAEKIGALNALMATCVNVELTYSVGNRLFSLKRTIGPFENEVQARDWEQNFRNCGNSFTRAYAGTGMVVLEKMTFDFPQSAVPGDVFSQLQEKLFSRTR